jgi:hypothetical protein
MTHPSLAPCIGREGIDLEPTVTFWCSQSVVNVRTFDPRIRHNPGALTPINAA